MICPAQPKSRPAMLVHSVRRGKCTSPLMSVKRSSSCEEPSRLYCCHTSRTVMPGRGLRAASKVVIVQSGATICGTGKKTLASTTAAATQTILVRASRSTLQILIRTAMVDVKSRLHSLAAEGCKNRESRGIWIARRLFPESSSGNRE